MRRLTDDLCDLGNRVNHRRVARLKQQHGIYPKQHKAFVVTTNSRHGQGVAENVLDRQFRVDRPNAVWVSDITYIATKVGWVYLAVVLDLYSRPVIGGQLAEHMKAELVCEVVELGRYNRGCLPELFHSDRGSQYVSEELEDVLSGTTISMSRQGHCWDNAVAESFFGTLKTEHVHHERYNNIEEAPMDTVNNSV